MARKRKPSKRQLETLRKYGYDRLRPSDYKPRFGRGSRGSSEWNYRQKAVGIISEEYSLTGAEKRSAQGYLRRIQNVINLAKKDEKVRDIMNRRLQSADEIFERIGYKDITELNSKDIETIIEASIAEGGLISIPSFANPKTSDGEYAWESK